LTHSDYLLRVFEARFPCRDIQCFLPWAFGIDKPGSATQQPCLKSTRRISANRLLFPVFDELDLNLVQASLFVQLALVFNNTACGVCGKRFSKRLIVCDFVDSVANDTNGYSAGMLIAVRP
jgi:hypothetical protein